MLHRNIKTQEYVLARPTMKKPAAPKAATPRKVPAARTPAAPKDKAILAPVAATPAIEAATPAIEAATPAVEAATQVVEAAVPQPVECPVDAGAAAEAMPAPVETTPDLPVINTLTPLKQTVAAAAKTKGTFIMSDPMETVKSYAEEAKTRIQGAMFEMNEKAKTAMEKSAKAMEEMGELAKGNLEAMVESSKIAAKGVESMSQEAVEFSRKSFEKSSATFKSFAAVKSPTEFFQLQSELLSSALDSMASAAAKNSETMLKLAGEVSQPISNRVAIVSERIKALAA